MEGWNTQVASDVQRDGLGVELLNSRRSVVAEVFRCDANNSVFVNSFDNEIPLTVFEWFLQYARTQLGKFEDGTPLPLVNDKDASGLTSSLSTDHEP